MEKEDDIINTISYKRIFMKKTIYLSLVAGAMIFAGCGGGGGGGGSSSSTSGGSTSGGSTSGGSTSGGSTSGGSTSGGSTSGGTAKTYSSFQYPAGTLDTPNLITPSQNNLWIVNPDARSVGASAVDKTYAEAEQYCSDRNQSLPTAKDLLTTRLHPDDNTTASWAAGKFVAYFTDNIIGQSADEEANTQRKVICMNGDSIEKKHATTDINVTITENNATKTLQGVRDVVTGLSWTPIYIYDEDTVNPGHANEFRFPVSGAQAPQIDAADYCTKFGAGWRLPTLAELRTITYFDGTTGLADPDGLKPTVIWTDTEGANAGTHYTVQLNPNRNAATAYYKEAPEADTDANYVTCVK